MHIIYLDHHATTPMDPAVLDTMLPYFTNKFGNPASRSHAYGWEAEKAVEAARVRVAELIGATSRDIIFTSGATESINLALKGIAGFYQDQGNHIITAQTEHRAVLDCCQILAESGFKTTYIPVDKYGVVAPENVSKAITEKTILISLMFANHEIGTIHDVAAIGKIAKDKGVFFFCDATQAIGKEIINVEELGVDLLSVSGHKIYGPKGVGALYVRRKNPRVRLLPLISGGGHERNHRSGTLNVPGIVGLGKASQIMQMARKDEQNRIRNLRNLLQESIETGIDDVRLNGHPTKRLAGNLNMSFADVNSHALIQQLQATLAISSGASCTSAIQEPSYVLKALGVSMVSHGTIRVGIGRFNTEDEIRTAAANIIDAVIYLRQKPAGKTI